MANIIDKRFLPKDGSITNRQKFIKRYKKHIKKAVRGILDKESIKDFKFKDKKIKIKTTENDDSLDLPSIQNDPNEGIYDYVHPGNKTFKKGQKIDKDQEGGKKGRKGSNEAGDDDGFEFTLTEQEFADLFFEDLALPDLIKRQFTGDSYEIQRCGYSNTGGPSSLNLKQTVIRAFMRRHALKKQGYNNQEILDNIETIRKEEVDQDNTEGTNTESKNRNKRIIPETNNALQTNSKRKISFFEETDLRYNYRDKVELPSTKAVMFALMDVSGSMGEKEKDIAKRFFLLLKMFLDTNYDQVDIVFVRHAEWAEECEEDVFFHGRESGGTVISTGFEKILDIIKQRYNPELWNVYIAQASDGDNFEYDNDRVQEILTNNLLPITQYFSYIEILDGHYREDSSNIYNMYESIGKNFKQLQVRIIKEYTQIFEVFRSLFKKKETNNV